MSSMTAKDMMTTGWNYVRRSQITNHIYKLALADSLPRTLSVSRSGLSNNSPGSGWRMRLASLLCLLLVI